MRAPSDVHYGRAALTQTRRTRVQTDAYTPTPNGSCTARQSRPGRSACSAISVCRAVGSVRKRPGLVTEFGRGTSTERWGQ